jgi:uncharacterized protein (DUF3820 family)
MSRSTPQRKPEPISDIDHVMTFGKYKGEAIVDILDYDPNYLIWLHNNSEYFELDYKLLEIAEEGFTTEPM